MKTDNRRTYIKYAIGEIVLVVIGILIALQINQWNQVRIDNKQEQQILIQLKGEFEENLKELNNKMAMRTEMSVATKRLFEMKQKPNHRTPIDSIRYYIYCTYYTPTFDPVNGAINELLTSGKLYIINNNTLKTKLTNWSGMVNRLTEYEQDVRQYLLHSYDPYLTKYHSLSDLFDGVLQLQAFRFGEVEKVKAVKAFLADKEIDDYLFTIATNNELTNQESVLVRKYIEDILMILNQEIND